VVGSHVLIASYFCKNKARFIFATRAAALHFTGSLFVAACAGFVVFGLWYPYPYSELAGGKELFFLVVSVDVASGPLLTVFVFTPSKLRSELLRDFLMIAILQIFALCYGLYTVWEARPLFLVAEIDRFKVISAPQLSNGAIDLLPKELKPALLSGPKVVSVRMPNNPKEQLSVIEEALSGGPDLGERPEYYVVYGDQAALQVLKKARPLAAFIKMHPEQRINAELFVKSHALDMKGVYFLPIISRQAWVALLNGRGEVIGFLQGEGF